MDEQMDLFAVMDREDLKEQKRIKRMREGYRLFITEPDMKPLDMEQFRKYDCITWCEIVHVCDHTPEDRYCWLNNYAVAEGGGEYWLHHENGKMESEHIEKCPYCGADLRHGEGDRFMKKWQRGYTFYQEASVRRYYNLDEIDKEIQDGIRKG